MQEPIRLEYEDVVLNFKQAISLKGEDYVYDDVDEDGNMNCRYFNPVTQAPSCIVGHVLAEKGATLRDIGALAGRGTVEERLVNGASVFSLQKWGIIEADDRTATLMSRAQSCQDNGDTWVDAVEKAIEEANTL